MLKIDNNLLVELGLSGLPDAEKNSFLKHIYETLEMRVGIRLADQMTNQQLDEFEQYFEAKDDAGAFKWLETNFPNYKDIVQEEFDKLKAEVAQSAPQILAASQAAAAQNPAASVSPNPPASQPPTVPQPQSAPPTPPAPTVGPAGPYQPQPPTPPPATPFPTPGPGPTPMTSPMPPAQPPSPLPANPAPPSQPNSQPPAGPGTGYGSTGFQN